MNTDILGTRGTKLTLTHESRLGLEIWIIRMDGRELHMFLSERHARTRFESIRKSLGGQ